MKRTTNPENEMKNTYHDKRYLLACRAADRAYVECEREGGSIAECARRALEVMQSYEPFALRYDL